MRSKKLGLMDRRYILLSCFVFVVGTYYKLPLMLMLLVFYLQVTKVVPAVTEEVKDALVKNIRRRMTPQPMKIRADIELKCFQFDGVVHIKVVNPLWII